MTNMQEPQNARSQDDDYDQQKADNGAEKQRADDEASLPPRPTGGSSVDWSGDAPMWHGVSSIERAHDSLRRAERP